MPKLKEPKTPTPVQVAAEAARTTYKAAREAWDGATKDDDGNPKGKAAEKAKADLAAAKTARDAAEKAENRERFTTLGKTRVNNALKAVSLLNNIANLRMYDFTQADVDKLTTALDAKVASAKQAFADALSGPKAADKKADEFSF